MLGLRKPNFKTKTTNFEKSRNAENCETKSHSVFKNIKKLKGPFGDWKFSKKMRIFNSLKVPKNLKEETLWDFLTSGPLQNIQKLKGGHFGDNRKNSKKSLTKPKRVGRSQCRKSLFFSKTFVQFSCFLYYFNKLTNYVKFFLKLILEEATRKEQTKLMCNQI